MDSNGPRWTRDSEGQHLKQGTTRDNERQRWSTFETRDNEERETARGNEGNERQLMRINERQRETTRDNER